MWWKTVTRWVRERVELDAEVDIDGRSVVVLVTVRFAHAVLVKERFEWTLGATGRPAMLLGHAAKRYTLQTEVP
jgi:hypothetical protein